MRANTMVRPYGKDGIHGRKPMNVYERMENCIIASRRAGGESLSLLLDALKDDAWEVRYSAAVGLGDLRDAAAIDGLLALLKEEDAAPLFTQPGECFGTAGSTVAPSPDLPQATAKETLEAWRRRGRVKQAACFALGAIGKADPRVLDVLHRYAVDTAQDYMVRAAACKALGQLASPASKSVLEAAANDEEWCTKTEARKALAAVCGRIDERR
ncbi:MAG TPA: HEAT repeat domain-containing protein [Planctomycetota bacterium]|nr:HEAT repeat domain-containing protein [Planctomycetota bacterium]